MRVPAQAVPLLIVISVSELISISVLVALVILTEVVVEISLT